MKHLNLLTGVLVLIVGIWALVEFRQRSRRFPGARLDGVWRFLAFYNAITLTITLSSYGLYNIAPLQLARLSFWYKVVELPLLTALTLGVHLSLYRAVFARRGREMPRWIVPAAGAFGFGVVAWSFLASRFPALRPPGSANIFWLALVWIPGLLDVFWLGRLLAESRKAADPGRRRADAAFALLFLARYPLQLGLSLWNRPVFAALALVKLHGLYTNLMPLVWLKAYFTPWAGSLGKVMGGRFDLAEIGRSRGLTAREMQILELMIDGKSYKEIEAALHISIHTVKTHVYSLYRKLDVKSRPQLIHRIGVYGGEPGSEAAGAAAGRTLPPL